jgi:hypothetical protein
MATTAVVGNAWSGWWPNRVLMSARTAKRLHVIVKKFAKSNERIPLGTNLTSSDFRAHGALQLRLFDWAHKTGYTPADMHMSRDPVQL